MAPPDAVIQLRGIRALCICGALPEEQDRRQPYEFDVDIVADLPATATDVLADTIDYGAVLARIEAVTRDESFQLFERMPLPYFDHFRVCLAYKILVFK